MISSELLYYSDTVDIVPIILKKSLSVCLRGIIL